MDGSCEFMRDPINSTTDPILAEYLRRGMHCSIGTDSPAYANGEACGACYKVKSTSDQGWSGNSPVSGAASEAIVTVSTGGINGTGRFDCFPEAFEAITGATTSGEFEIEFEEVECDAIRTTPSVTSFEENNKYYCKMVFNNIGKWGTLSSVEACLGDARSNCAEMTRLSGQAWQNCPQGDGDKITFFLTQQAPSGQSDTVECICAGGWPWEQGEGCTCGVNFGGISISETSTTVIATSTIPASGEAPDNSGDSGGDDADGSDGSNADGSDAGGISEPPGTFTVGPDLSGTMAVGCGAPAGAALAVLGVLAAVQER